MLTLALIAFNSAIAKDPSPTDTPSTSDNSWWPSKGFKTDNPPADPPADPPDDPPSSRGPGPSTDTTPPGNPADGAPSENWSGGGMVKPVH